MIDFSEIGFSLPDGLPHKEYALCDGWVSAIPDESGGVNLVEYQGPERTDRERRGAFFSNGIWRRDRFFDEPVIEFAVETAAGPVAVDFCNLTLCPFGVSSTFEKAGARFEYALWLCDKTAMFEWCSDVPARVTLCLREDFLNHHNDVASWDVPEVDAALNGVRYQLRRNIAQGAAGRDSLAACSIVGASGPIDHVQHDGIRQLALEIVPGKPGRFAMVFGEDPDDVLRSLEEAFRHWQTRLESQFDRYRRLAAHSPRLAATGPGSTELGEIVRTSPLYAESMRRRRNSREVGFRASTRGYGVWNGWDGQWAFMLLNACGDAHGPDFLSFLDASRGPNGAIPMTVGYDFGPIHGQNFSTPSADRELGDGYHINHEIWGLANLHQYCHRTGDETVLKERWPAFAESLRTICRNASEYGLVGSCFGGADYSDQCERPQLDDPVENNTLTSRLCGVEDMAVLHTGCIQGAELAARLGDRELVEQCAGVARRLQDNYASLFVDEETGYLLDCVWPKEKPVHRNRFCRITSLLALYGYGELLLLDHLESIADHVRTRHRDPALGLCDVPSDHPPTKAYQRWDNHWLQNATAQSLKLARLAGDRELMDIQLEQFADHFAADKLVHEDLYHACPGGKYKPENLYMSTSWWQGMTAYAWWLGILESVAGIRWERGQIEIVPGDGGRDVTVENLHWGGRRWRFEVRGRGKWVEKMTVNEREQAGSYQIRPFSETVDQGVVVARTEQPPSHPVLLSAGATPVSVRVNDHALDISMRSPGFAVLHFYSPARPVAKVNGRDVDLAWSSNRSEGSLLLLDQGDLDVSITSG